jgi:predicted transcriptional regulator
MPKLSVLDRDELLTSLERLHDRHEVSFVFGFPKFRSVQFLSACQQVSFVVRNVTILTQVDLAKAFKISPAAVSKLWNQTADQKKKLHDQAAELRAVPKRRAKAAKRKVRVQIRLTIVILSSCCLSHCLVCA